MIWKKNKLNEICDILIGGTPSRGVVDYWKDGTLPWVSIRDMSREGAVINNTNEKITEKGAKESNVKLIPKGSLLFSFKLSIGKLAIAGSDLYTNEAIAALVIKDKNQLDKNFLRYYISQMVFDDVTTAVKGSTLNKEKIKNLEIPLPPLEIQKKIVAKLDEKFTKIREAKKLRQEALTDTEKILSQTLLEIFEDGKNKFEMKNLGDVATLVRGPFGGSLKKEIFVSEGIAVYEQGNVIDNVLDGFRYFITSEKFKEMKRFEVSVGDILMSCSGTIGKFIILPDNPTKGIINQALLKITPKNTVCVDYLKYALQDYLALSTTHIKGGAIKNIASVKELKQFSIPLPSIPDQQKIVTKLDKVSEKIKTLHELQKFQLEDLKKLEKAYLKEAFNGELI